MEAQWTAGLQIVPTRRSFGHSLLFLILAVALFVFAVTPAKAQVPRLETKNGHQFATVVFMRSFWSGHPQYYSIAIDSVGDAAYECSPRVEQQTGVPYMVQFHASASMRERTFNLAQQLKFFQLSDSEVQSSGSPNYYVAENQSKNTLEFREGTTDNSISYHESRNTLIQQITSLFEGMENTLQFGRNLTYLSRNRSPELATQLKQMQDMAAQGKLLEVQAAAPTLENIASDESLSQVARQRAKALLKSAAAEIATP